jgi:hypothetical protein
MNLQEIELSFDFLSGWPALSFEKPDSKEMRKVHAPFSNLRLIRFDIAVHIYLKPTRVWIAFNPPAHSMTELLRAGAAADTSLRPAALPAQSQAGERSKRRASRKVFRSNQASLSNERFPAAACTSTRSP